MGSSEIGETMQGNPMVIVTIDDYRERESTDHYDNNDNNHDYQRNPVQWCISVYALYPFILTKGLNLNTVLICKTWLLLNGDVHPLGSADVKLTHDTTIHTTCWYKRSVWRAQSKIVESAYIGLLFINHGGLSQWVPPQKKIKSVLSKWEPQLFEKAMEKSDSWWPSKNPQKWFEFDKSWPPYIGSSKKTWLQNHGLWLKPVKIQNQPSWSFSMIFPWVFPRDFWEAPAPPAPPPERPLIAAVANSLVLIPLCRKAPQKCHFFVGKGGWTISMDFFGQNQIFRDTQVTHDVKMMMQLKIGLGWVAAHEFRLS